MQRRFTERQQMAQALKESLASAASSSTPRAHSPPTIRKDAQHDAAVTHTRSPAVYEDKPTVEHCHGAAQSSMDVGGEAKKRGKVCSVGGCPYKVHGRGFCHAHGRKPCSIDGCTTNARAYGFCGKHGEKKVVQKKVCSAEGCPNKVHARGLCGTHGAKPCYVDGCMNNAIARGMCYKHDAHARKEQPGGMKIRKVCSVGGCPNIAKGKGVCTTHSRKPCWTDGCTNQVRLDHSP